jgi:hypothetical protein
MSFNLKDELLKLTNAAPSLKDSDDEFDYDGKILVLNVAF